MLTIAKRLGFALTLIWASLTASALTTTNVNGLFTKIGTLTGQGTLVAKTAGVAADGSLHVFLSYSYVGSTFEVLDVDEVTGTYSKINFPTPAGDAAYAMTFGPDQRLYVGSDVGGYVYRYDPLSKRGVFLGSISRTESYVFGFTSAADGNVYGCTFPNAKLVRINPFTGVLTDLGTLDSTQKYARSITADQYGSVYIWTGLVHNGIISYDCWTGSTKRVTPAYYDPLQNWAVQMKLGSDGSSYLGLQAGAVHSWYRGEGLSLVPIAYPPQDVALGIDQLANGDQMIQRGNVVLVGPPGKVTRGLATTYAGKPLKTFRLGIGSDAKLYVSGVLSGTFSRLDPVTTRLEQISDPLVPLGVGEAFGMLTPPGQKTLAIAMYAGAAPIILIAPPLPGAYARAAQVKPVGLLADWKPMAQLSHDTRYWFGGIAGYSHLTGDLVEVPAANPSLARVDHPIPNQGIVGLTWSGTSIVGATTIYGGASTVPTTKEAQLFIWDPVAHRTTFQVVPVPGANYITNLVTLPSGKVLCFAGTTVTANNLVIFDPVSKRITRSVVPYGLGSHSLVFNSIGYAGDGFIYGLCAQGVFKINPTTLAISLMDQFNWTPLGASGVNAGFAISGKSLFFGAGSDVIRYDITAKP